MDLQNQLPPPYKKKNEVDGKPSAGSVSSVSHENIKDEIRQEQVFGKLVEKSDKLLIKIKSIFPFDFFPNEISVDVNKVNIINNYFLSKKVHSVMIKDICDVYIYKGVFFSSLSIIDWGFDRNRSITINYLSKRTADEALKIIQGLMVSAKQNIDVSKIDVPDFRSKVKILGEPK
jgi:hypothetical protein